TSFFTGIVTAWQAKFLFSDIIPATYLGTAVGKAVMIELGPVLTSLVVAGRIGAAMASQLGTMNVTEQIDAMQCLSLDPFEFLYSPRFFASVMMLPIITIISGLTGIIGALLISVTVFKLDSNVFLSGVKLLFEIKDVVIMILKAFIFGGIISLSGCFYGYITVGGAEGVGKSTKASVVSASVWILILDFIVVSLFL
ncbi:MAG: MlaE family ABC transporter permease, partial [Fibrobacterota bacterium]